MDNGQNKQSEEAYFSINKQGTESSENPNADQGHNSERGEHNLRSIGGSAISSPELFPSEQTASEEPPLGEIVPVEPSSEKSQEASSSEPFEPDAIHMEGDRLNNRTLNLTENAERRLRNDDDVVRFVKEINDIKEALVKSITEKTK